MEIFLAAGPGEMEWVNPIIQLVTAGGFGALVWYLVVRHIPAIEERHKQERKEWQEAQKQERQRWSDSHDKRDEEFLRMIKSVADSINELRHDIQK